MMSGIGGMKQAPFFPLVWRGKYEKSDANVFRIKGSSH